VNRHTRKPFVTPQLKEEASLVGITLISGCNRGGSQRRGKKNYGHNSRRGHGGRST
jgi:hypothetical protein